MTTRPDREQDKAIKGSPGPDRDDRRPEPLDDVLIGAANSIAGAQEKSWHLEVHSPRWALRRGGETHWPMLALAALLAFFGFFLAVRTIDRVLPKPGVTAVHVPLALLVGTWSVVFLIFAAAVGAGLFVYRSGRLELRMSAHPSAAAEAERAAATQADAFDALLRRAFSCAGAPDPAAVAAELRTLMSVPGGAAAPPPASASVTGSGTAAAATTKVVDPQKTVSPKVVAGAATSATSAAFWIVAASTFWHSVQPTVLTALATGVTAISGAIAAWWKTDPLRVKQLTQSHPT
jgi:hypothetical protein